MRLRFSYAMAIAVVLGGGASGCGDDSGGVESTLAACQDGVDNDQDGHTDCADQDCQIYSMCAAADADADAGADADADADADGDADSDADGDEGTADDGTADDGAADPCIGHDLCLTGTFTITDNPDIVNTYRSTDAFDGIEGHAVDFVLAMTLVGATQTTDPFYGNALDVEGSGAVFTLTGSVPSTVTVRMVPAMQGIGGSFTLASNMGSTPVTLSGGNFVSPTGTEYWGFEISGGTTGLGVDATGYPVLGSFSLTDGSVILRRYQTGDPMMTDFASGTATIRLE
jgi:hypothetical protein